jgi:carboxyl-terminal processing protease
MRCAIVVAAAIAACGDNIHEFPPSADYAAHCDVPRTGTDPITGSPYPDVPGTTMDEKLWVRSWIDELYLWYDEVPNLDASRVATPIQYFSALKTYNTTPSGKPKDQFHFTYDTAAWESLAVTGVEAGYGASFAVVMARPPRQIVVAYTEPGSPADGVLGRGDQVLLVDGLDVENSDNVDGLNEGLFPSALDESHTFVVYHPGDSSARTVQLTSASITGTPVQHVGTVAGGAVGYIQFNDHVIPAELELVAAITQLQGVSDLVLDLRYNGGGYLAIASELAFMIAGPTTTANKTFDQIQFNAKYPTMDPVTGDPITPTPFLDTSVFQQMPMPLPHLDLPRVFVLTGPNTCSASEAIINGLTGVGVQVIQIGDTTCGKPYGFYPQDNCGVTYFSIEFRGVNDVGFGDYSDGFSADGSTSATLPGCVVADDFAHALGDPAEGRLAAALQYRASQTCPPTSRGGGVVHKPLWLQNRIYMR